MNEHGQATLVAEDSGVWSRWDRWLRERLLAQMATLQGGSIVVVDALGSRRCGDGDRGELITLRVHSPRFYRAAATNGSVGAGEAYIAGDWHCDDLVGLVRLLVRNRELLDGMEGGLARLGGWLMRGWHALRRNTRAGARRNIAAHYDLGHDFLALFLSDDLMYSSALFTRADDTLEQASWRKLERVAA